MSKNPVCLAAFLAPALLCAACAPKNADMLHFLREHKHQVSAIEYRVGIPDSIGLSAPRILEIDGEVQSIQPDGKINLRLLGEVKIVGMTAKEIAAKVQLLLGRYYLDPKVSVRILDYASKKFYMHGQVGGGPKRYTGKDSLVDVILTAGVDYTSWTSRVKVVRPSHGDTPVRTLRINVDKMIREGDWSKNILLEPDDIVYIPPTPLAWVGLRVRELLQPVGPAIQAYTAPAYVMAAPDYYDEDANISSNTGGP